MIESIGANSFQETTALEDINLKYNKLTIIEPQFFTKLVNLKRLNISWNKLKSIDNIQFNYLEALSE